MQFKTILSGILLNLSFFPLAHANIYFPGSAGVDLCANVTGHWEGAGKVSTVIHGTKITCDYSGNALVSKTPEAYSADVTMKKTSGSSLCPDSESYSVPGTCNGDTGVLILHDDKTDLKGQLYDNGTKASFTGTVTLPVKDKELIATVEQLDLSKV